MSREHTPLSGKDAAGPLLHSFQQQVVVGLHCSESSSALTISDLPDDVMLKIFSYLSISEIVRIVQNVCSCWRDLAQHTDLWYNREYVVRNIFQEDVLKMFKAMPQLRKLKLTCYVFPHIFEALSESCRSLMTLECEKMQPISYSVAKKLFKGCNKIRTLKVPKDVVHYERFLDAVEQLPHLQVLQLLPGPHPLLGKKQHVQLRGLANSCPQLRELHLWGVVYNIQDVEYFINSKKHLLKHLEIKWTSVEGRCIVPLLAVCAETLECLCLIDYDVSEKEAAEVFTAFQKFQRLHTLSLCGFSSSLPPEFSLAFRNSGLSKLRNLKLQGFKQEGLEILLTIAKSCPQLQALTLEDCSEPAGVHPYKQTFKKLESVCKFENVKILKVISSSSFQRIEGLRYIARMPALSSLYIEKIKFLDQEYYLDMSGLRYLSLCDVNCYKTPFIRFPGRLVNLRELVLDRCYGDKGKIDKMRTLMPELNVNVKILYSIVYEQGSGRFSDDDWSVGEQSFSDDDWSGESWSSEEL